MTADSMFAANTGAAVVVAVVLGGTPIPLPDAQSLDSFIANGANTVFTVPAGATGRYYLTYNINLTVGVAAGARLTRNGAPIPGTGFAAVLSLDHFSSDVITPLNAGDTISLELFGVVGVAALQAGSGASLTIIRVE